MKFLTSKWLSYGTITAIIFLAFFFSIKFYGDLRVARAHQAELLKSLDQANKRLQETNKTLEEANRQVETEKDRALEYLEQQKRNVNTPEQAVKVIKDIGEITQPITVQPPALPDAPSTIVLTSEEGVQLAKRLITCREHETTLAACEQEQVNLNRVIGNQKQQLDNKDKAITLVKGGGFWSKTGKVVKCISFAAGGGGLGASLGGARGGAIGAGLGVAACQLRF